MDTAFVEKLIGALTPIVGRVGVCRETETGFDIRFPDAVYWLQLEQTETDVKVLLEHRCVLLYDKGDRRGIRRRDSAFIEINPQADVAEAATHIDKELFQNIRPRILQMYEDYPELVARFSERYVWQKAYRRRMLLDIWSQIDGDPETFGFMGEYFEDAGLLMPGLFAINIPELGWGFRSATVGEDLDDDEVMYCLGYLTRLLDQLEQDETLPEYTDIEDWREHFLGPDETTSRSRAEMDEWVNDHKEQMINLFPLSVLKAGEFL